MKADKKVISGSEIEVTFELTAEEFAEHTKHALEHLKHHVKVDGFRQGKAPASMVEDKIKPEVLLMEAGDHAAQHVYADYVAENKIEPIGSPEVQILKVVPTAELSRIRDDVKNGIGTKDPVFIFKAKITVLPEIKLPGYRDIAAKVGTKEISVNDKEVEDAINYLQKTRAKLSQKDSQADKKDFVEIEYQSKELDNNKPIKDRFILGEAGFLKEFEDNLVGMKAGDEKEFTIKFPEKAARKDLAGKDVTFKVKMLGVQKMELPEINDEFAKTLGAFDTLVALKTNIKEGITTEKTEEEKQRRRAEILEKIAEKCDFQVPTKLVEYEQEKLFDDFKNEINSNLKVSFEQYLASVKQTEEDIKKTFEKQAEKRLKTFLVLREIGKLENVEVTDQELEDEMNKSVKHYSKEQLEKIDIEQLKEYNKGVIFNEKIFQLLENLSQKS